MSTKVIWQNRLGERREHNFGYQVTLSYARDWFRRSIIECQGVLSIDERRGSKLELIEILNQKQNEN